MKANAVPFERGKLRQYPFEAVSLCHRQRQLTAISSRFSKGRSGHAAVPSHNHDLVGSPKRQNSAELGDLLASVTNAARDIIVKESPFPERQLSRRLEYQFAAKPVMPAAFDLPAAGSSAADQNASRALG